MVDGPDTQAYLNSVNDRPGDQTAYYFANDELEAGKFNEFYPTGSYSGGASGGGGGGGSNAAPWWASLATYGATKAIDAAVGPRQGTANGQSASYAGQNGRTYGVGQQSAPMSSNTLILMLAAGAALLLL